MYKIPKGYEQDFNVLKGTTDSLLERYEDDSVEVDYDVMEAVGRLNTVLNRTYYEEKD